MGHTGTLDPLATGVLVIAVGQATKIIELLVSDEKEYVAEVEMGLMTDTLDVTGEVLEQMEVPSVAKEELSVTLDSFQGTYEQEVPKYSAVRVKGKRLYEYARSNQEVTLPKRMVTIKKIHLLDLESPSFTFSAQVSKGTYMRSLIRDIGVKLGVFCVMKNLKRVKQGIFGLKEASTIEEVKKGHYHLLSIKEALKNYDQVTVSKEDQKRVQNGMVLFKCFTGKEAVMCDQEGQVLAIYREDETDPNKMKPWKVFSTKSEKDLPK